MPTYDYVCEACEHAFEEFQSITAKPLKKCPECGKNKLQRLIGTGAGVIFKGNGFYQTDYRGESYKKGAEADKSASEKKSDGDKKSDTKSSKSDTSASKPAEKAGSKKKAE